MRGLIAPLERRNGWTLAEEAGHTAPDRMHRLLNRCDWEADDVLDDVRGYVVEHLGDPEAVLIVDHAGFLKTGVRSAGVQRQYSGTAGRTENCQVGVYLAYARAHGRTLIDRKLYLPTSWTDDRERCRAAGIEGTVAFETKVVMAKAMVRRAITEKNPFRWVTPCPDRGRPPSPRRTCPAGADVTEPEQRHGDGLTPAYLLLVGLGELGPPGRLPILPVGGPASRRVRGFSGWIAGNRTGTWRPLAE